MKQMREDAPNFIRGRLLGFMYGSTADISVEYADYVIARGFIEAIQEWIDGCNKSKSKLKVLQYLQGISHLLPGTLSFINGVIITFYFFKNTKTSLSENPLPLDALQYGILFFSSFMLTSKIASFLGGALEDAIDRYSPLSYLYLNKGDERVINDYKYENSKGMLRISITILSTIILGVISSLIANSI
ncbi:hypothetical protein [Pectobacterium carotovorum]|nr:hypothetical protein [Pectobacterium carotovorum]